MLDNCKHFFVLTPEVAGEIGKQSDVDFTTYPPAVKSLDYVFHGWLGDELIECFPCFIVTRALAEDIQADQFTGYQLDNVHVRASKQFQLLYPTRKLPEFKRLIVVGQAGQDDFSISRSHHLVVSARALDVLKLHELNHCEIVGYKP